MTFTDSQLDRLIGVLSNTARATLTRALTCEEQSVPCRSREGDADVLRRMGFVTVGASMGDFMGRPTVSVSLTSDGRKAAGIMKVRNREAFMKALGAVGFSEAQVCEMLSKGAF